ncbi:uncharacterized protein HMPREF1541_00155 [Cyphellophora europaea CBS 101466]|uniref:Uncharacterized protein n=1 Tax=Cyphellophora europaea (strain CBS 101466) TaxID=1220924 RepID=W2SD78_CYPE1|nr:uncharacterized protein HMPREF1541_00155 [Cyphellophora europaea CBS 101466]ETN45973.1 hypothetical protein HMPREF1541_00155 [Cyphellophora europaea CBS 101466]
MSDNESNEPTLPPLPAPPSSSLTARRSTRPSLLTRKRTHSSYASDWDTTELPQSAASSDPALFSGDEAAPGLESYASGKRKKKLYAGSWWNHRVKAGKDDRKREFKRNVDSGVWMGSEDQLSSDSLGSMEEAFLGDQGVLVGKRSDGFSEERTGQEEEELVVEQRSATNQRITRSFPRISDLVTTPAFLPQREQVKDIVRQHLNSGKEDISFDGMGLVDLPDEVIELATLTKEPILVPGMLDTGRSFATRLHILLGNNLLTRMPCQLLELENLQYLSLRGNRLKSIPVGIRRLVNLQNLNISNNELRYLPFEVLELARNHSLSNLRTTANPWAETPAGLHVEAEEEPWPGTNSPLAAQRSKGPSSVVVSSSMPSLTEVVLRQLQRISPRDDLRDFMPEHTPARVLGALDDFRLTQVEGERRCTACWRPMVQPGEEWLEWWFVRISRMYVPFKRAKCYSGCDGKENMWVDTGVGHKNVVIQEDGTVTS